MLDNLQILLNKSRSKGYERGYHMQVFFSTLLPAITSILRTVMERKRHPEQIFWDAFIKNAGEASTKNFCTNTGQAKTQENIVTLWLNFLEIFVFVSLTPEQEEMIQLPFKYILSQEITQNENSVDY